METEAKLVNNLVSQLRKIEHDVLTGLSDQIAEADPEYSEQLAELKQVTDDLRTSLWCAFVAKNSPEKVRQFVERHKLSRVFTMLRNRYPMEPNRARADAR